MDIRFYTAKNQMGFYDFIFYETISKILVTGSNEYSTTEMLTPYHTYKRKECINPPGNYFIPNQEFYDQILKDNDDYLIMDVDELSKKAQDILVNGNRPQFSQKEILRISEEEKQKINNRKKKKT